MKTAATILLLLGISSVGLSFVWSETGPVILTAEEEAALEADAIAAHTELESPSEEQLKQQREAQERIAARVEEAEAAASQRSAAKRWLRLGGCLLAAVGVAMFWQTKQT